MTYTAGQASGDVETIVATATQAAGPHDLEAGSIYGWMSPQGQVHKIDLTGDEYLDEPNRKKGTVYVEDLESFIHYWRKHSDPHSELYVNVAQHFVTGVLDAHTDDDWEDGARWGQHRVILKMPTSQRWDDWTGKDRQPLKQIQWAEFIEDHLDDIRVPDAATMLEIAQTFQTSTKVKFGSNIVLANGDRRLEWEETTGASAGEGGKLTVPATFTIGVAPFDFSETFEVKARFRYRVSSGELTVCYLLDDPAAVIKDAVLDVVKDLEEQLNAGRTEGDTTPPVKVMRGTPA